MPLVSARCVVLQATPYSETSKILRLYTQDLGLRSVIAKGAMRPRSRFGGVLEPFTEGVASFYLKDGRDLHTLSGFELVRSRQALGRSLPGFAGAALLAELVLRAGTEEPHPELFAALVGSLDAIAYAAADQTREILAFAGAWRLVSILGFEPELERCVVCGRQLDDDQACRFDAVGGGAACTRCRPVGRLLDPGTRREVRGMIAEAVPGSLAQLATHRALLRAFLQAQVAPERPLRSLDLFLQGDNP